jgi:peptidoglycan/xylan/chitin deacetylase (PgdA/CDA1 family)
VALTFDDGPSDYTQQVLRILVNLHASGTFFEIGRQTGGRHAIMRRILADGSEIGDHTENHVPDPGYGEIATAKRKIRQATGFTPCLLRPPDGVFDSGTVSAAHSLGMRTILWNVDPRDWSSPGSGAIYSTVINTTRPGSIIIMHDGGGNRSETVKALKLILKALKKRHLISVTLPQLLNAQPPEHGDLVVRSREPVSNARASRVRASRRPSTRPTRGSAGARSRAR